MDQRGLPARADGCEEDPLEEGEIDETGESSCVRDTGRPASTNTNQTLTRVTKPIAKHDMVCDPQIHDTLSPGNGLQSCAIGSITDLVSAVQSSLVARQSPRHELVKLVSVHTYDDAPTDPKRLSGVLSVRSLVQSTVVKDATRGCVARHCRVGVFLPHQCVNHPERLSNSNRFCTLVRYLQLNKLALLLSVDSVGRFGIISPRSDCTNNLDDDCDAIMHVMSADDFLQQSQKNQRDAEMKQLKEQYKDVIAQISSHEGEHKTGTCKRLKKQEEVASTTEPLVANVTQQTAHASERVILGDKPARPLHHEEPLMLRNQQNNVMKQAALDGKESECSSVLVDCGSFVANIEQIVDTTPQTVLGTRIVTLGDKPKSRKSSRQGQSPLEVSSSTSATNLQEMYRLSESLHSIRDKERALEAIACCSNAAEAALKTSPPGERSSLEVQVLRFATNPATDRLVKLRVLDALRSVKPQLDFELACIPATMNALAASSSATIQRNSPFNRPGQDSVLVRRLEDILMPERFISRVLEIVNGSSNHRLTTILRTLISVLRNSNVSGDQLISADKCCMGEFLTLAQNFRDSNNNAYVANTGNALDSSKPSMSLTHYGVITDKDHNDPTTPTNKMNVLMNPCLLKSVNLIRSIARNAGKQCSPEQVHAGVFFIDLHPTLYEKNHVDDGTEPSRFRRLVCEKPEDDCLLQLLRITAQVLYRRTETGKRTVILTLSAPVGKGAFSCGMDAAITRSVEKTEGQMHAEAMLRGAMKNLRPSKMLGFDKALVST
ncbi:hypothetical protein THAOC_03761, partial [Thalassiosira oceanica]